MAIHRSGLNRFLASYQVFVPAKTLARAGLDGLVYGFSN